ncbi:MAG: sugar-binding domain-containing protein [Chloroflexota bacterium]
MTSIDFNFNWRFALGDHDSAYLPDFDDSSWRRLRLPHDWSIEFPFDQENGDGATGYLPGGIGWYRKRFELRGDPDQQIFVLFDGVYNNCEIWCNGALVGENRYGYSPFWFDLTPYLNADISEQLLTVRVDRSRSVDSRWYTGSGIYRDVQLVTKAPLHIPIWGTRITTPVIKPDAAEVELEVTIQNASDGTAGGRLVTDFVSPDGEVVATAESRFELEAQHSTTLTQSVEISQPELWVLDSPRLYQARSRLFYAERPTDSIETRFGLRSFRFDPAEGFFFNGKNTQIKGVCLHHDAGLVGAAVPDGVWRRRLLALKAIGCNAVRISHNPSSASFLDLCDELGFLVQVEFFDEWENPKDKRLNKNDTHSDYLSRSYSEHFAEWAESDLKRTMLRDRNHPCVFQWSIGNEVEWTFPRYEEATGYFGADSNGNYFWTLPPYDPEQIRDRFAELPEEEIVLAETARRLAGWTREMDKTRPVVANCILPSASMVSGYADALDIVGYSYRQVIYDASHAAFPEKVIMGTENLGQWHEWQHVLERPFISGIFIWTGIHYMGECHDRWPQRGTPAGLLDFAGFTGGSGLMYKTLWRDDPQIFLTTQQLEQSPYRLNVEGEVIEKKLGAWKQALWVWHDVNFHWNYAPGEEIAVEVYSNCDEVELFLNGRSLGRLPQPEDRIYKWMVPFESGTLEARGGNAGREAAQTRFQTAGNPAAIELTCDRAALKGDGYDVAHAIAQLVDQDGIPVKHAEREILFSVAGAGRLLGVDNGSPHSVQPYQTNRLITSQGRALMIVQAGLETGEIVIHAKAAHMQSRPIEIKVRQ